MFTLALRGVRYNLGRYLATLVAIVTGIAFFAASGFVGGRVIAALEGQVDRQYAGVDAAVVVDGTGVSSADGLRVGGDVVDRIAALPEVAGVAGELVGNVSFLADDGSVFAEGATGRLWIDDDALNPTDIDDGAAPVSAGEIAIDRGLADDHGLGVGHRVTILTLAGEFDATITAVTTFGDAQAQDSGGTVSIPSSAAFEWLNRGFVEFSALYLRTDGEVEALIEAVGAVTPAGFRVQTGDGFRDDQRSEVGGIGRSLRTVLQGFSLLALVVGGFVISNTFSVIVAQRTRELAVLAAIGATPRQLKRSLRFEALAIGVLGSIGGIVVGFAMAFGLIALVGRLGAELPGRGIPIAPGTINAALVFGVIITMVSVSVPARRAGRAEPIEALRQADAAVVQVSRIRTTVAAVLIGGGAAAMLVGPGVIFIGAGVLALFVGVIAAGPLIAVAGSVVLRPILGRLGLEGELATDNTARNPQRTATTANALLIGVFLVTFVTVAGTSAKDFAVAQINQLSTADFTISSTGGTIDDQLVAELEAVEGVEIVTPFRRETVALAVDGNDLGSTSLSTGDLAELQQAAGIELAEGSYDDLGTGSVVLLQSQVADGGGIGSTARFTNSRGESIEVEVVGVIGLSLDSMAMGAVMAAETFDEFVGVTAPTVGFVATAPGAQTDVADRIAAITDRRPDVALQPGNLLGRFIGTIFDFVIGAVNGLLLMSVVIALIGIVNTMTLSIMERRRELALLRIVGMLDRRVRRMVRIESVVIAALGTSSGMALGISSGIALVSTIARRTGAEISVSLPPVLLVTILVLGVLLGLLAALVPAHRSTRLGVLDAVQAT